MQQLLDRQRQGDARVHAGKIELQPVGRARADAGQIGERRHGAAHLHPRLVAQAQRCVDGAVHKALQLVNQELRQYRFQLQQAALQTAQGLAQLCGMMLALSLAQQRSQHG